MEGLNMSATKAGYTRRDSAYQNASDTCTEEGLHAGTDRYEERHAEIYRATLAMLLDDPSSCEGLDSECEECERLPYTRHCFKCSTMPIAIQSPDHYRKLTESKAGECEHPTIIAGRIRQQVESLANIVNTEPLQALCDALDQSITVHMLSASLRGKNGWAK